MRVKFNKTMSARSDEVCKNPVPVERRLNKVCKKLNATEVNIGMFQRMLKRGVLTNDVRCFTMNQHKLKKTVSKLNNAVPKAAMKQKLNDAYSTAGRLRREKKYLSNTLSTEFEYSKSKTKRVIKRIMKRANDYRYQHRLKVRKKFEICRKKTFEARAEEERN